VIKINNEGIRIRPSAVNSFYSCAFQWGKNFLEGAPSHTNSRAAIGTSIHAAVEELWTDAIATGSKDANITKMTEAAMEAWKEETHDGVRFDEGETHGTAAVEILRGAEAFVEDIVPFTVIPDAVEEFYKIDLDHPLVSELGGTVDYITSDTIADVKTSKRKINAQGHSTQQSIYKYLAQANGVDVKHNLIQGVVLKKSGAEGSILSLEANIPEAKARINMMLDTLDVVYKDVAPIETILRPNPGHYLCSPKFCAFYGKSCPGIVE